MHCQYCSQNKFQESRFYNIENVRERFIPTYYHSQIFGQTQPLPSKVRCSPTFHSSALRVDKYGHNCKGKCQKKTQVRQNKTNYGVDAKKTSKNGDFNNARGKSCYNRRAKWYDQEKNQKFNHIQATFDYSKERKIADLASSSVFEGYVYEPLSRQNQLCQCQSCQCVDCNCGKQNDGDCECCSPKKKAGKCIDCAGDNCQCASPKQAEIEKQENKCQSSNCNCVHCECLNCNSGNCKCGVSQAHPQQNKQEQKNVAKNQKQQEITFGKKGGAKIQLGQTKKMGKEKQTFTVIRQKK